MSTIRNFKEHLCENNDDEDVRILPISRGGIVNFILRDNNREHSLWINYCPFCGKELIK